MKQRVEIVNNSQVEIYSTAGNGERKSEGRYPSFRQAARRKFLASTGYLTLKLLSRSAEAGSLATFLVSSSASIQHDINLAEYLAINAFLLAAFLKARGVERESGRERRRLNEIRTTIGEAEIANRRIYVREF